MTTTARDLTRTANPIRVEEIVEGANHSVALHLPTGQRDVLRDFLHACRFDRALRDELRVLANNDNSEARRQMAIDTLLHTPAAARARQVTLTRDEAEVLRDDVDEASVMHDPCVFPDCDGLAAYGEWCDRHCEPSERDRDEAGLH